MISEKTIIHTIRQRSEEWENIRSGKLTASEFSIVMGQADEKKVRLISNAPVPDDFGRAQKQAEVCDQLQKAGQDGLIAARLNASGLKGLKEKGIIEEFVDDTGCSLKKERAAEHIDRLLARKKYTPAECGEFEGNFATERGEEMEELAKIEFESKTGMEIAEVGFVQHPDLKLVGASPDGLVEDKTFIEIKSPLPQTYYGYLRKGELPKVYRHQVYGTMALTGASHCWFMAYHPGEEPLILRIERTEFCDNLLQCLHQFEAMYLDQMEHMQRRIEYERQKWEVAS